MADPIQLANLIKNQQIQDLAVAGQIQAGKKAQVDRLSILEQQKQLLEDEQVKARLEAKQRKDKDAQAAPVQQTNQKSVVENKGVVSKDEKKKTSDNTDVITLSQGLKQLSEKHNKAVKTIFVENKVFATAEPIKAQQERILAGKAGADDLALTNKEKKERKAIMKEVLAEEKKLNKAQDKKLGKAQEKKPVAKPALTDQEKYIRRREARQLTAVATALSVGALNNPATRKAVIHAYAQVLRSDRINLLELARSYSTLEQVDNPPSTALSVRSLKQHYYLRSAKEEEELYGSFSKLFNNDEPTPAGRAPIAPPKAR